MMAASVIDLFDPRPRVVHQKPALASASPLRSRFMTESYVAVEPFDVVAPICSGAEIDAGLRDRDGR
jgi:hypothetical protein